MHRYWRSVDECIERVRKQCKICGRRGWRWSEGITTIATRTKPTRLFATSLEGSSDNTRTVFNNEGKKDWTVKSSANAKINRDKATTAADLMWVVFDPIAAVTSLMKLSRSPYLSAIDCKSTKAASRVFPLESFSDRSVSPIRPEISC